MVEPCGAFNRASDTPVEDLGGGIRRQILAYDNSLMLVKVWFEANAEGYAHSHPHTQVTTVIEGRFRVTIDGETTELVAGDTFYAAPNKTHGMTCLEAGYVIDSFSPVREDFLS